MIRKRVICRQLAVLFFAVGLGLLAMGTQPTPAHAAGPIRVGWWNTSTANGAGSPSPTTPAGGLRVAAGSGTAQTTVPGTLPDARVLAYGAVIYELPEGGSATLTLKIAQTSGTPLVVACPTSNANWTAGDDQPAPGPSYSCEAQHFAGTVSTDGTTIAFKLTAEFETTPGEVSLAIVPDLSNPATPVGGAPFSLDLNPPDAAGFSSSEPPADNQPTYTYVPPPAYVPPPDTLGAPLGEPAAAPAPVAQAPAAAPARPAALPVTAVANTGDGWRARLAEALGIAALGGAVLLWSFGFGLLGGRITPLSVPVRHA
jgi:hypothetical protein